MGKVVAIHQPNFLPWTGFFDKMDRSDVFVLLDRVQLIRRSFTTRTSLLKGGNRLQISIPVQHIGTQDLPIGDAIIDPATPLLRKTAKTLRFCYGKCTYWRRYGEPVIEILTSQVEELAELNIQLIRFLAEALGISWGRVVLQSELAGSGKKSELMATLTKAAGGSIYLLGGTEPSDISPTQKSGTAADYNDPAVYASHGLKLVYQNFVHPEYEQGGYPFIPGLSVLDLLVRLGAEALPLIRNANPIPHRQLFQ